MEVPEPEVVDLPALARSAIETGVLWRQTTGDLNINLLAVDAESGIAEHVNAEVDVLLLGVEGHGRVFIDGKPFAVGPGQTIVIPKASRRSIVCEQERFIYLTCHRRRGGLQPH